MAENSLPPQDDKSTCHSECYILVIVFCVGEIRKNCTLFPYYVQQVYCMENTVQWLANTAQWAVQRCQESN